METNGNQRKTLVFALGAEEYGIDILKVQEIRGYDTVTRIANAPQALKGVINLRGSIVPIVDLRLKFGLGEVVYDDLTVVIILNVGKRTVGIVVDGVSDVVDLHPSQIRPAPELSSTMDTDFLEGLGALDEDKRMIILMDIERMILSRKFALLDSHDA